MGLLIPTCLEWKQAKLKILFAVIVATEYCAKEEMFSMHLILGDRE